LAPDGGILKALQCLRVIFLPVGHRALVEGDPGGFRFRDGRLLVTRLRRLEVALGKGFVALPDQFSAETAWESVGTNARRIEERW